MQRRLWRKWAIFLAFSFGLLFIGAQQTVQNVPTLMAAQSASSEQLSDPVSFQKLQLTLQDSKAPELQLHALPILINFATARGQFPLPTKDMPETERFFQEFLARVTHAAELVNKVALDPASQDRVRAAALDTEAFLNSVRIDAERVSKITAVTPAGAQIQIPGILPTKEKQVPPLYGQFFPIGLFAPHEAAFKFEQPLKPFECVLLVKEVKGVKAILVDDVWWWPPFFGFSFWWIKFVPAQFLKTVTYCHDKDRVTKKVDLETILEDPLTDFWWWLPKDP